MRVDSCACCRHDLSNFREILFCTQSFSGIFDPACVRSRPARPPYGHGSDGEGQEDPDLKDKVVKKYKFKEMNSTFTQRQMCETIL